MKKHIFLSSTLLTSMVFAVAPAAADSVARTEGGITEAKGKTV